MKKKGNILFGAIIMIGLAALVLYGKAQTQKPTSGRIELQRHDLSTPGREVIQVIVKIEEGVLYPKHKHPGEEIVYVLQGLLEYEVEGKPPVTLKPGHVLFIPSGAYHTARNVGRGTASELATYIVEKGQPLLVTAK